MYKILTPLSKYINNSKGGYQLKKLSKYCTTFSFFMYALQCVPLFLLEAKLTMAEFSMVTKYLAKHPEWIYTFEMEIFPSFGMLDEIIVIQCTFR